MNGKISDNVKKILICPNCESLLHTSDQGAACDDCQSRFGYTKSGSLDLRLQNIKTYQHEFTLGKPFLRDLDFNFDVLAANNNPDVDFSEIDVPDRLTKELMSYFPKAKADNSLVLDLGCGDLAHKQACEIAGFEYVGIDYETQEAPILGDAHALPFKNESFDFILSSSAIQYFRFPTVAMREAYRVLKPNGLFIGTVAFLEPFHETFYHFTHWGVYNSLQEGGFKIMNVAPSDEWSVLIAQARMGLFPKMPQFLQHLIVLPIQLLHKTWWRIGSVLSKNASEEIRIRNTTGSFDFICQK